MKRSLSLCLFFAASTAQAAMIEGRVIEVVDGATLTVLSRQGASIHRVRIAGIDAPRKGREHESTSRANLRRLAIGKTVRVETSRIDTKGLLVGTVLVLRDENQCKEFCPPLGDPGLTQLSHGFAMIDKAHLELQSSGAKERYLTAEAHARSLRLGIWRGPNLQVGAAPATR